MEKDRMMWLLCYNCSKETKHKIQASFEHSHQQHQEPYRTIDHKHFIVQCGGCENTTFLHEYPMGPEYIHRSQYPDPAKWTNTELFLHFDQQWKLPEMIRKLYSEVRAAFCEESSVLSGLGLRTLVESICIEQQIPGTNLVEKIKNLQAKGLISASELPILDKLRQIGNVSAHEIKGMPMEMLEHAIQIVNHILKSVYILPALDKKITL